MQLQSPLPGEEKKVTPIQAEAEGADFMALMASGRQGIKTGGA